jgi:hypothetical protein
MNKLTIQINNKEALERLIGNDTEVEIDIRNSVVQKFAEKHLKPIANADGFNNMLNSLRREINKQVQEKCEKEIATFKTNYYGVSDVKLRPEIITEIDWRVKAVIESNIQAAVEEAVKKHMDEASIQKRINAKMEYYTDDLIRNEVRNRIEELKKKL